MGAQGKAEADMRRILVVDDDAHVGQAISLWLRHHGFRVSPDFLRLVSALGATRCLRKPFKPATLLGVIDGCLAAAEPHRRQIATLGAVAEAVLDGPEIPGPAAGRSGGSML
jgi:DNA-binding response OmpR family regulator